MKASNKKEKAYPTLNDDRTANTVSDTIAPYGKMYVNQISLLTYSKNGLNAKAALDFISISGFTYDEFQETFKTTVKTIQNYVVQDLKLDAALSEKLLKSFSLFDKGLDVFGSVKDFHQWLATPAYGLGNQIPISLMDTITGITLIEEEIIRIAYGDLA
ncbi:MAG: MbcA/ParS/Xre antitoxin family protein [Bacteroidetes bacterium]|nr:MbcA/ParS/Xre antitoxin family protein [Bacteroidota bacterium]MBU1484379.1 MbcA/ParS/Xre antitoxin family protein [Bacteroidota bacterium]MBU1760512.1 MbcA/ParS/Xre antitoxin family protein [Bacteroidota bacterium]MBU2045641.1 MbcA/ParS/Xre antitoxin family protein [Bacteroidota bacterium]MBU2268605.1 MbcA/ParS/Xre antitoxin family protein [Bacteroidota bacterium]